MPLSTEPSRRKRKVGSSESVQHDEAKSQSTQQSPVPGDAPANGIDAGAHGEPAQPEAPAVNGYTPTGDPDTLPIAASSTAGVPWPALVRLKPLPSADGKEHIWIDPSPEERQAMDQLWQNLPDTFKTESRDLLLRAYLLASYAHRNAQRDSGEPYVTHPVAVTEILTELRMDPEALAAGLLHDVAEDTEFGIDYILSLIHI